MNKTRKLIQSIMAIAIVAMFASCSNTKQTSEPITHIDNFFAADGVAVEKSEFPMIETAKQMLIRQSAVGVNNLLHNRVLTPTDDQPVVGMNRDTYYSMGVVNVSEGATITMPEIPAGKYMSLQVIPEDHRTQAMVYGGGEFELTTHTGEYVFLLVRLDATFSEAEANALQDQMIINAGSDEPFSVETAYNKESFDAMELELKMEFTKLAAKQGPAQVFGAAFTNPHDESAELFDEAAYLAGSAAGWAGAQAVDNFYELGGLLDSKKCYAATFEDPKNKAFWSLTVYDKNTFMFSDTANVSSDTAVPNADGTFTLHFGCEGEINNLPIDNETGIWRPGVRHYQASDKVTKEGFRILPLIKEVK